MVHKVPQGDTLYHKVDNNTASLLFRYLKVCNNAASLLRLVDYTSNHLPISSLTENKRYAATEALDNTVCYPAL